MNRDSQWSLVSHQSPTKLKARPLTVNDRLQALTSTFPYSKFAAIMPPHLLPRLGQTDPFLCFDNPIVKQSLCKEI